MADHPSSSDERLDALVAEYYEARDAGRPLSADELAARHPDFAAQIRQFIGDIENVAAVLQHRPGRSALEETVAPSGERAAVIRAGSVIRYFGDYEILGELGRGGMGVVYQARQQKLKRIVALKMIKVGQLASESEVQRFEAEARAAARLSHPGIVAVHEVGTHDGQHFYTMDFVAGGSLAGLHRDEPVAARRSAELVKQLAEAVQYAHEQGVVHRDLKPANVLLTAGGAPRITDFGLAKRLWTDDDSAAASLTESGQIIGTAGYMSPEQAAGKTRLVGPPADIYSLGAILYALLTSRAPFVGESQADTILQVIQKEPVAPRTLNPSTPRDLETICLKCLEKEPHKRYGTAQLLAADLQRFLENRPVLARPISRAARAWRWCRRNPWAATALALVMIVAIVAPPVAWRYSWLAGELLKIQGALQTTIGNLQTANRKVEAAKNDLASANISLNKSLVDLGQSNAQLNSKNAENERLVQTLTAREKRLRLALYHGDVQRLPPLLEAGNAPLAEAVLKAHLPEPGQEDIRSFEWYYLWLRARTYQQIAGRDLIAAAGGGFAPPFGSLRPPVALSPDLRFAARCTAQPVAYERLSIAKLAGGGQVKAIKMPGGIYSQLAFSLDGSRIAVASISGVEKSPGGAQEYNGPVQLVLIDAAKQELLAEFAPPPDAGEKFLTSVAFDAAGRVILPSYIVEPGQLTKDRRLTIWDVERKERLGQVPSKTVGAADSAAVVLAVSADGRRVACADPSGKTVEVLDWENQQPLCELGGFGADRDIILRNPTISALALSSDGKLLAVGGLGRITLCDTALGQRIGELKGVHTGQVVSLAFSSDGRQLLSGGTDALACLWSVEQRRLVTRLVGHRQLVAAVGFGARDELHTVAADLSVKQWRLGSSLPFQTHRGLVKAVSPDGERFVEVRGSSVLQPKTIVLRDARTGGEIWTHPLGVPIRGEDIVGGPGAHADVLVEFLPNGKSLFVQTSAKAQILDRENPAKSRELDVGRAFNVPGVGGGFGMGRPGLEDASLPAHHSALVWNVSADGRWAVHAMIDPRAAGPAQVRAIRLETGEVVGPAKVDRLLAAEFEPATASLLVATLEPGKASPQPFRQPALAFMAGSQPLVVVTRWQIEPELKSVEEISRQPIGRKVVSMFNGQPARPPGLLRLNAGACFEPASGEAPAGVLRYSLLTGQAEATYDGPATPAGYLALHPDGRTLVTSGSDLKLRFWDVATASEKLVLDSSGAGKQVLGFFANGRILVTRNAQSGQHAISYWRGASDAEIAAALAGPPAAN